MALPRPGTERIFGFYATAIGRLVHPVEGSPCYTTPSLENPARSGLDLLAVGKELISELGGRVRFY
jgi:hypothetical protein